MANALLSSTSKNANVVLSGGSLTATGSGVGATDFTGACDTSIGAGQSIYWEIVVGGATGLGFLTASETFADNDFLGHGLQSIGWYQNGQIFFNFAATDTGPTYATGNRLMIALQGGGAGKYWLGVNGTWEGDPSAGTGGHTQGFATVFPAYNVKNTDSATFNFGGTFVYAIPTGFLGFNDVLMGQMVM